MDVYLVAMLVERTAVRSVVHSVVYLAVLMDERSAATMVVDSAEMKVASSVGPKGILTAASTADRLAEHSDECSAGLMADETAAMSAVSMAHRLVVMWFEMKIVYFGVM